MEKRKPRSDGGENPFSFRTFLTTAAVPTSDTTQGPLHSNHESHNPPSLGDRGPLRPLQRDVGDRNTNPYSFARFIQNPAPNSLVDNGLLSQGELPDFVQDHFASSSNIDPSHRNGLPDFTFHTRYDLQNHYNDHPLSFISPASSTEDLFISRPIDNDNSRTSTSINLPDFLSDTGINIVSKDNDPSQTTDVILPLVSLTNHINGAHSNSGDGDEQSARISQLEHELSQKNIRIQQLEQQLAEQKRKEEEDTEIMDTMMRQVDENLAKAVERWQKSELEVERLTSKVHQLDNHLSRIKSEKSIAPMHLVRHIGSQLSLDLMTADNLLRQFLEHSDKMKTWAGHLQSLDRVEEAHDSSDSDHCPS